MQDVSGVIFDIKKYSIHDGPGIRSTVFYKGCPLRCWWCHNPESQKMQPEIMLRATRCICCEACVDICLHEAIQSARRESGASMPYTDRSRCQQCGDCIDVCYSGAREWVGVKMTVSEVMRTIERDQLFYEQSGGGVTISGGEPLMQPEFLLALLTACKAAGIHTALDTSGYAAWHLLKKFTPLVDLFLYDLKFIDNQKHRKYTGVSNHLILSNLHRLTLAGAKIIARLPIIPDINDDEISLQLAGEFLSALPVTPAIDIIPYHSIAESKYESLGVPYRLAGLQSPDQELLIGVVRFLQGFGLSVSAQSLIQPLNVEV